MISKTILKEQIEKMPDKFSINDLVERLILIEKIENGLEQSKNGEVISDEAMDEEIDKWFE